MKLKFTGCQHYGHKNIIRYCDRPFDTVEEMNKVQLRKHNERVKDDDVVYNLGDFCFHSMNTRGNGEKIEAVDYIKQLKGNQIFIVGNHDKDKRNGLKTLNQEIILSKKQLKIQLLHDPTFAKINYDLILCSHVHNAWKIRELRYCGQVRLMINCGVDVWGFMPVDFEEVLSLYYRWLHSRKNLYYLNKSSLLDEINKEYARE